MKNIIVIWGNGYVAQFLVRALVQLGWYVYTTSRKVPKGTSFKEGDARVINFEDSSLFGIIRSARIMVSTIPPDDQGFDPVLANYRDVISRGSFEWVGYLSSTVVYGNHDGEWVNENTKCFPNSLKAERRLCVEAQWLELFSQFGLPIHIFRLSGIYGHKRNCLEDINNGKDFTVRKEGHYFSRIHVADICKSIITSMSTVTSGEIYNLADDEPAPLHIVQQYAAEILNKSALIEVNFEDANLSNQLRKFFQSNRRIDNNKISNKLHINWTYPNYRLGLFEGCLPYLNIGSEL